jgi:hypothetical protein
MSGSRIAEVRVDRSSLTVTLTDQRTVSTPLSWYPTLTKLSVAERNKYTLIGKGRGIEWDSVDYQLSLEGMLLGIRERGL